MRDLVRHTRQGHARAMLTIWGRLWKGEEAVTKGSGRQGHRTTSLRTGTEGRMSTYGEGGRVKKTRV
jgi:hypothetical protein